MAAPRRRSVAIAILWLLGSAACSNTDGSREEGSAAAATPVNGHLFSRLPSSLTGVRFENRLRETRELNVFTYRNFYNGGGVALGDLTGDSLPEILLTSNTEGPRLFMTEGQFRFRDITSASGLKSAARSWTTGVTLADVNGDGRLDIYVSRAGHGSPRQRANALWIHQGVTDGVPHFVDMAEKYGIDDEGFTTHAAFLDHDRDGDLDLFLINNSPRPVSSFGPRNTRQVRDPYGGHKLYRNDGDRFTDVSARAGIHGSEIGFGLGVVVSDVNRDGWPDIYVANDFFERDYLFINGRNGTFSEALDQQMPSVTYFSMGVDVADLDNDQWPDIYTTDMLPEDEYRLKTMASFEGWDAYQAKVRDGYHHQFMRNMLQYNNGDGTFSDIGQMAGVAQTDWTWGALIADLDLDGRKDIYVTNGIARDITSQDYVAFLADRETMKEVTGGGRKRVDFERLTRAMPSTPLANYAFRNRGDWRFTNEAAVWGLDTPAFSSGAAYGDLDGDGALDLVVNNVNGEAFVYRNNARRLFPDHRFVRVRLDGSGHNRFGIGARVTVHTGTVTLMQEQAPSRGFQSSVDYVLNFGLGMGRGRGRGSEREADRYDTIDSVRVVWPDGRISVQLGIKPNELLVMRHADATLAAAPAPVVPAATLLADVTEQTRFEYRHQENDFVDFERERLIPKMLSLEGPAMAVADVNGDGLDDVFVGGAKEQPGRLMLQRPHGSFAASNAGVFEQDAISEDVGAAFFDADGDSDLDLYVVSGGNEFSEGASGLQDRLYLNDGGGRFRKAEGHLPADSHSGSRVVAADYDQDGHSDLFVGGRVVPWKYGVDPVSMLLRNDGRGRFTDVTESVAPGLSRIGMVTDALWYDVDSDGRLDLVIVGEWMPITIYRNVGGGRLTRLEARGLEKSHGWWNRIIAADFTRDGRVDFVVGNLGLNSRLRASEAEPATLYVKDFDGNGFFEQVLACYNDGTSYPIAMRNDLIEAIPALQARFPSYKAYARRSVSEVFTAAELEGAVVKHAYTFATSLARQNADGSFTLIPLPREAQVAPVYGILADDLDGDGATDLLLAGNFDGFKPEIGRMRAGYGLLLRGDRGGAFTPVRRTESGFFVPGQSRDIRRLRTARGPRYAVARNNDRLLVFRPVRGEGEHSVGAPQGPGAGGALHAVPAPSR
ncbi:MAG: VCBS repeat-containing protein [Gemmatimonadaceae bacterium]